MTIGLDDYVFQLGDDGVPLNDDSAEFVDILNVTGLDNAPYRETIRDHEGTDGGFIDAEFEKGRDVILSGVVYANVSTIETYLDSIKENFAPVTTPIPLYLKAPGVAERLIFVKSRGARYDWTSARRLGVTDIQLLMFAEDPRIYSAELFNESFNYGGDTGLGFSFGTDSAYDDFQKFIIGDGWGSAKSGEVWTTALGGVASDYTIFGSVARTSVGALNSSRRTTLDVNLNDSDTRGIVSLPVMATGDDFEPSVMSRYTGTEAYYYAEIELQPDATVDFRLILRNSGATILGSASNIGTWSANEKWIIRLQTIGTAIKGKAWEQGTAEPDVWHVEVTDATWTTGDNGTRSLVGASNTNTLPIIFSWDNFTVTSGGFAFNLNFGGGATPGGGFITVGGNRPTPVEFIITGPVLNPVIKNLTTGQTLSFNIDLPDNETLTINTRDRTVYLNGGINRRSILTTVDWIMLEPGQNEIFFGGLNGATSTLEINYRDAWR